MPRTIYLLLGGFLLAILFYEAQIWQAIFASAAFFTLVAVVEVLAMLLIGLRIPDTDVLMQAGAARLIYVVFSNLIQIPLLILVSHFFSRKENVLRVLWLLPIIAIEEMQERVNAATARYHELGDSIKAAEQRMAEIAVLRAHIVNYAKTRPVYDAYRKAGYSKKFLEEHREQITLHKAAKAAFDEASLKKLPKVKELDAEYAALLSQKKAAYPAYRKARDEMQELKKAQKNVELFFAEEKDPKEKSQTR